jgi:hypothetical protein
MSIVWKFKVTFFSVIRTLPHQKSFIIPAAFPAPAKLKQAQRCNRLKQRSLYDPPPRLDIGRGAEPEHRVAEAGCSAAKTRTSGCLPNSTLCRRSATKRRPCPPKTGQRTHTGNGPAAAAKALRTHRTTLHQQETAFRPLRTSTPPARERHPPIFPKIRPQSARHEILRPGGRNFAQFFLYL